MFAGPREALQWRSEARRVSWLCCLSQTTFYHAPGLRLARRGGRKFGGGSPQEPETARRPPGGSVRPPFRTWTGLPRLCRSAQRSPYVPRREAEHLFLKLVSQVL